MCLLWHKNLKLVVICFGQMTSNDQTIYVKKENMLLDYVFLIFSKNILSVDEQRRKRRKKLYAKKKRLKGYK